MPRASNMDYRPRRGCTRGRIRGLDICAAAHRKDVGDVGMFPRYVAAVEKRAGVDRVPLIRNLPQFRQQGRIHIAVVGFPDYHGRIVSVAHDQVTVEFLLVDIGRRPADRVPRNKFSYRRLAGTGTRPGRRCCHRWWDRMPFVSGPEQLPPASARSFHVAPALLVRDRIAQAG